MTTTVTGLYDSYPAAKSAVDALEAAGISSSDISVVANNGDGSIVDKNHTNAGADAGAGAGLGAVVGGAGGLLAGLGMMAIPGVGPVVDERVAYLYAEGVGRGGTLVAARVDGDDVVRAQDILGRYQPVDPIAREAEYRQGGWRSFDETAPLYNAEEIEAERRRYH
jgi:hypothetical protein